MWCFKTVTLRPAGVEGSWKVFVLVVVRISLGEGVSKDSVCLIRVYLEFPWGLSLCF